MNLFRHELKKIWNWRILTLIAALAALVWFSILSDTVRAYETASQYGASFGPYAHEMFEKYGSTLEPEELADYNIPGKKAALYAELNTLIANDTLFTDQGLSTYAAYADFRSQQTDAMNKDERNRFDELMMRMDMKLSLDEYWNDPQKQFASPYVRLGMLSSLQSVYTDYERDMQAYIEHDKRPVVVDAARKILAKHNNSLFPDSVKGTFSGYMTVVGVSIVLATLLLVSPALARDRAYGIHMIQYSSNIGRRILFIQWAAALFSACVLSILLLALSALPLLTAGFGNYANTSMLSAKNLIVVLYELTFGQYATLLAGMILLFSASASCFAFWLARFSSNLMHLLLKIVPLGIALRALYLAVVSDAFFEYNTLFNVILKGRIAMPEPILCLILLAVGIIAATTVTIREKKVDVI